MKHLDLTDIVNISKFIYSQVSGDDFIEYLDDNDHGFEISQNLEDIFDDFVDYWETDKASDSVWREDPMDPDHIIVFAGGKTYGDDPKTWGFTKIKLASYLGWLDLFNIY